MDSARLKLTTLQILYTLSIALPVGVACLVLTLSFETIYYRVGLSVYGYITMMVFAAPCFLVWLITRRVIQHRKIGNIAWLVIIGIVLFLHFQPQFWALPESELEKAKQESLEDK